MKKTLTIVAVSVVTYVVVMGPSCRQSPERASAVAGGNQSIAAAVQSQARGVQVEGEGTVIKLLEDDIQGSRHQRILLRLASGGTLLVAHNIDLAPRVEGLREGETLQFYGEFDWNEKGGVVHWTHHDPGARYVAGWIRYKGRRYQ